MQHCRRRRQLQSDGGGIHIFSVGAVGSSVAAVAIVLLCVLNYPIFTLVRVFFVLCTIYFHFHIIQPFLQ
jgi:hypothetical protein